jgi:hypothetical protein
MSELRFASSAVNCLLTLGEYECLPALLSNRLFLNLDSSQLCWTVLLSKWLCEVDILLKAFYFQVAKLIYRRDAGILEQLYPHVLSPCSIVNSYLNVRQFVPDYKVQHLRRQSSRYMLFLLFLQTLDATRSILVRALSRSKCICSVSFVWRWRPNPSERLSYEWRCCCCSSYPEQRPSWMPSQTQRFSQRH